MSMPAWATDPDSLTLTEDQYDGLPDHVRKLVEVIGRARYLLPERHARAQRRGAPAGQAAFSELDG